MGRRTRAATVARFRADMSRLLDAIAELSPDEQSSAVYDGWTVKDMVAHIAAWDRELARGLDELLALRRPAFTAYQEADFNARAIEAARPLSFDQVVSELRSAHEALLGRIEALTDEEWERSTEHRWGSASPMTVASLLGYSYKRQTHYGGHAREIEEWAGR